MTGSTVPQFRSRTVSIFVLRVGFLLCEGREDVVWPIPRQELKIAVFLMRWSERGVSDHFTSGPCEGMNRKKSKINSSSPPFTRVSTDGITMTMKATAGPEQQHCPTVLRRNTAAYKCFVKDQRPLCRCQAFQIVRTIQDSAYHPIAAITEQR